VGTEGLKAGLLSAVVIASLILSVNHVAHAQLPAENVFEVSPGSFTVRDAPPFGEPYLVEQKIAVWNRVNEMRIFTLSVRTPPEDEVTEGFDPIPNGNWIILTPAYIEIEGNSSDIVEIFLNIPRWENLTSQRWEAWIGVTRRAEPGEVLEIELISRARIETTEELPPIPSLPRDVEVSISPSSGSGPPGSWLTYAVTVRNTGRIDDTYTLSAVGAAGLLVSIEPTLLPLAAGDTDEATLSVVVHPDASEGGSMTATVSARSEGDPMVVATDTCRTIVTSPPPPPLTSLTISEENFTLQAGESKYLTATLISDGSPVADKLITWSTTAGTIAPSSGKTNTAGQVTVVYTAPSYKAYVIVSASYAGSEQYEQSSVNSYGTIAEPSTGTSMELVIGIPIVIGCAIIGAALYMRRRKPTEFRW